MLPIKTENKYNNSKEVCNSIGNKSA